MPRTTCRAECWPAWRATDALWRIPTRGSGVIQILRGQAAAFPGASPPRAPPRSRAAASRGRSGGTSFPPTAPCLASCESGARPGTRTAASRRRADRSWKAGVRRDRAPPAGRPRCRIPGACRFACKSGTNARRDHDHRGLPDVTRGAAHAVFREGVQITVRQAFAAVDTGGGVEPFELLHLPALLAPRRAGRDPDRPRAPHMARARNESASPSMKCDRRDPGTRRPSAPRSPSSAGKPLRRTTFLGLALIFSACPGAPPQSTTAGRAARSAKCCSAKRRSGEKHLTPRPLNRLSHPPQCFFEPGLLSPEVEPHEARLAELRPR